MNQEAVMGVGGPIDVAMVTSDGFKRRNYTLKVKSMIFSTLGQQLQLKTKYK
jgi:hypothetical protein